MPVKKNLQSFKKESKINVGSVLDESLLDSPEVSEAPKATDLPSLAGQTSVTSVEHPTTVKKTEKARNTESWQEDEWNLDGPFTPYNKLKVEMYDENVGCRWVREDQIKNRLAEKWRFVNKKHVRNFNELPLQYGSESVDGRIVVGGLTLMMLHKELVKKRNEALNKEIRNPTVAGADKFSSSFASMPSGYRDSVSQLSKSEINSMAARSITASDLATEERIRRG